MRRIPLVRPSVFRWTCVAALMAVVGMAASASALVRNKPAEAMCREAKVWLDSLDDSQRRLAHKAYADVSRTGWHFIPKNDRKGVQLRDMTPAQEQAALRLLRSALSQAGYDKSIAIMELDEILRIQEGKAAKNVRDPKRYYFTVFGDPSPDGTWGLSMEGHHLSLNFTVRDGRVVDSTPQFMGANPAIVRKALPGLPPEGTRVLRDEETLAFELLHALPETLRTKAVISGEAPPEIRGAGEPQPPSDSPVGVRLADLPPPAQSLLRRLVETYCAAMPEEVAVERLRLIERGVDPTAGGWNEVHFAWAGSPEPGVGHSYRIEGATFLIEFVNVQPDAEGNPANHIHCVWRDKSGDFDLPR